MGRMARVFNKRAWLALPFLFLFGSVSLRAQEARKQELGVWIGASNPAPNSALSGMLDSTIGGGMFYRIQWPWILHTELGFSYAVYQSRTTQTLSVMPAYAAIAYQLPLPFRIQIFLKAGGGGAYLTVRPTNQSGWDPLYFLGTEFSILAGRRLRLGLRLDYNIISEQYSKPPIEAQYPYLFSSSDPRYQNTNYFKMTNGSFFHFGIMISFYM